MCCPVARAERCADGREQRGIGGPKPLVRAPLALASLSGRSEARNAGSPGGELRPMMFCASVGLVA